MAGNPSGETELARLLTQLLGVLRPAVTADPGAEAGSPWPAAAGTPACSGREPARTAAAPAAAPATPAPSSGPVAGAGAPPGRARADDDGGLTGTGPAVLAVSASEARALIELVAARGIAQGELALLLGLEKSTVSRLAAGLERKGWIRRGRDSGDQRYVRLYLTPDGGQVAARLWQAWQSRRERILAALSDEERAGLSAGLRGLVRGLAAEGLLGEGAAEGAGRG